VGNVLCDGWRSGGASAVLWLLHRRAGATLSIPTHTTTTSSTTDPTPPQAPSALQKSIPTALTLARVAAVPALAAAWFVAPPSTLPALATALFSAAAVTDFFDGALARAWDACTPFGAFLDPVADKLMVCTAVVLLAARSGPGCAPAWWGPAAGWALPAAAAAIIGREVAMSALREWAASLGGRARAAVAVSWAGKAKTAAQMVAVAVLLATSGGGGDGGGFPAAFAPLLEAAAPVGPPLLLASAGLGLVSLGQYVAALWPWLSGAERA
jgi:CDP-diacylglycerol---glycerol-3-phosphate 3-phosphatidyltransferase